MNFQNQQTDALSLIRALKNDVEPDSNVIWRLVRSGVNLNTTERCGLAALHIAVEKNYFNSARILLEIGASVNIRGFKLGYGDVTPLYLCSRLKHGIEMARLLIEYGADVNARDGNKASPLHEASRFQCVDTIQELVKNGANVNTIDAFGNTPLILALSNDFPEFTVVQVLLDLGADINLRGGAIFASPLHFGVITNQLSIVRLLLSKNAKVNINDDVGCSPLHWAATEKCQKVEIIRELLKAGAVVDDVNFRRRSVLDYAVERMNAVAARELLRCGAPSLLVASMEDREYYNVLEYLSYLVNELLNGDIFRTIVEDLIRYAYIQRADSFMDILRQLRQPRVLYYLRRWSSPESNLEYFSDACAMEVEAMTRVSCECGKSSMWDCINNVEDCDCDTNFSIFKFLVSGRPSNFKDHFFYKLGKESLLEMILYQVAFFEFKRPRKCVTVNEDCVIKILRYLSFEELQAFALSKGLMDDSKYAEFLGFINGETSDDESPGEVSPHEFKTGQFRNYLCYFDDIILK